MMKKYIVLGMLCLVGINANAQKISWDFNSGDEKEEQVSPFVKEKVEQYAIQIRQIVIEGKLAMNEEISKVDEQLFNGTLTKTEAENQKAAISLRFADTINTNIQNLNFDLDEITKNQVQYAILNTDVEALKEKQSEAVKEWKYKPQNEITGYFAYGMIDLPNGDNEKLNNHLGYSSGIDLGLLYHKQFSETSPFVFQTGAYFSWRTVRFDDNYFINRDENGVVDLVQHPQNLDKSKLRSTYIMVPVGLKYSFNGLKTKNDQTYRNPDGGFSIGANVYGGFRISTNNIVESNDMDFRDKKSNYELNNFAYGAQVTLSIMSWNFYVRQEFSSFFKEDVFDDRKMLQFGLNIGF